MRLRPLPATAEFVVVAAGLLLSVACNGQILATDADASSDTGGHPTPPRGGITCPPAFSRLCPNDPVTTPFEYAQCEACLASIQAYAACAGITSVPNCDANGMSKVVNPPPACQPQLMAISKCIVGTSHEPGILDAGAGGE
jgi:hypothetical protein